MGKKITYNCDICREDKKFDELVGLNFTGMTKFKFDTARATDGVHICLSCLQQIKEQIELQGL